SNWFKARTDFALAHRLRPRKVSDFPTVEDLRQELMRAIQDYRHDTSRGVVVDFDRATFDADATFSRLGGGSLGGKARGVAFLDLLLSQSGIAERFPGVRIHVPPAVVVGTEVYDEFVQTDDLRTFALECTDDAEIEQRCVSA